MRIFWKTSLFFRRYSHIFAMENQLPGFSIIRRYGWFFLMKIYFLKVNINVSINDYSFIYICVVSMLFKSLFLLSNLLCNVDFADWVSKKTNIDIIGFWLTHWIRLRFVKYRFVRYRFVRYWFRFVSRPWSDTDIPSKHFFSLQDMSLRRLQDLFTVTIVRLPGHIPKCFQDVFKTSSRRICKTSSRSLQGVFQTSW